MTMVDPVLVASQFDEDEAEAILRYNIRKYLRQIEYPRTPLWMCSTSHQELSLSS